MKRENKIIGLYITGDYSFRPVIGIYIHVKKIPYHVCRYFIFPLSCFVSLCRVLQYSYLHNHGSMCYWQIHLCPFMIYLVFLKQWQCNCLCLRLFRKIPYSCCFCRNVQLEGFCLRRIKLIQTFQGKQETSSQTFWKKFVQGQVFCSCTDFCKIQC